MANGQPIGNMVITLGMDGTQFGNTLDDIKRQIKLAESTMKANMAVLGDAGKSYEALSQKSKDLANIMEAERRKTDELTRRRNELIANGKAGTVQEQKLAEQINKSVTTYARYEQQLNTTKREMVYASEGVNDLEKEMRQVNSETSNSVRVMRNAGDAVGATERQYSGLQRQVELSSRAIQAQENVVSRLTSEFGENSTEVQRATDSLNNMRSRHTELNGQLESTSGRLNRLGDTATTSASRTSRVFDVMKGALLASGIAGLVSGLTAKFKELASQAIVRVDKIDSATKALTLLTESSTKAKSILDDVSEVIKGTPISLDQMTDATKGLIASGMEASKVKGVLQAITDSAYGLGNGAEDIAQISDAFKALQSSGVASLEDLNRLADANIPIYKILANQVGTDVASLKKSITDGKVASDDAIKMAVTGILEGTKGVNGATVALKGQAKNAGDTISGAFANMNSALVRGVASMFEPFKADIQNGLAFIGSSLEPMLKSLGTVSAGLRSGIINLFSGFGGNAESSPILKYYKDIYEYAKTLGVGIKSIFSGDVMDAGKFTNLLSILPDGAQERIVAIVESVGHLKDISVDLFSKIKAPLQEISKGIAKISFTLITNQLQLLKPLFDKFMGAFRDNVIPALSKVKDQAVIVLNSLGAFFKSEDLQQFLSLLGAGFKKLGVVIGAVFEFIKPVLVFFVGMLVDMVKSAVKVVQSAIGILKGLMKVIVGIFTGDFKKVWTGIKEIFKNALIGMWEYAKLVLLGRIFKVFKLFGGRLGEFFKTIGTKMKDFGGKFVNYITAPFRKSYNYVTSKGQALWNSVKTFFSNILSKTKSSMNSLYSSVRGVFSSLGKWLKGFVNARLNALKSLFTTVKSLLLNYFGKYISLFKNLGSSIISTFKTVVDWVKKFPEKLWTAILSKKNAMVSKMKSFGRAIGEGIEWGVNAGIRGINSLLHMIGVGSGTYSPIGKVKIKYAKGTDNHPGGLAMVNDGIGSNYKEIVRLPSGQQFIPQGRNQVLNLPKGSQVLPGDKTAQVMNSYGIPKYNIGTKAWDGIKSATNSAKDWVVDTSSKAWEGTKSVAKSVASKVTDYAELLRHPIKYTKIMVKDMLSKMSDAPLFKNFASGFSDYLPKQAKDYILKMANLKKDEELGGGFGDFGGFSKWTGSFTSKNNKWGVYDFLYSIAQQLMSSSMGKGLVITSGARYTDTYDHSRGLAIDLSGWGRNGGYLNVAKAMSTHPYIKYAIGDNTVFGRQYGNGSKPSWAKGHMNHVHLSALSPEQAKKGNSQFGAGSDGVQSWSSKISQVARDMKVKLSKSELQGILAQIQRESGGRQNIVQSSAVNDINMRRGNPARGLLQYIPQTFKNYAVKGRGNIMSGIDQLYAFFNNSNWRRDLPYGKRGWSPTGARRFANGGLITSPTLAMAGEAGSEMVIPLTRKSRAVQLLNQAQSLLGIPGTDSKASSSNDEVMLLIEAQNKQIQQQATMIELLTQLVAKDLSVNLDGRELTDSVNRYQQNQAKRLNQARGIQ